MARLVGLKPGRGVVLEDKSQEGLGKGQVTGLGECGSTDVWVSASHDNAHQTVASRC